MPSEIGHLAREPPINTLQSTQLGIIRDSALWRLFRARNKMHTFGRRLRAADVPLETRKVLLGHRNGDITTHYSAPELEELLEAAISLGFESAQAGELDIESIKRKAKRLAGLESK